MAVIDNDNEPKKVSKIEFPNVDMRSLDTKPIDWNAGLQGISFASSGDDSGFKNRMGDSTFTINPVAPRRGFDAPFSSVSGAELLENKRYPLYNRDINLEDAYSRTQPWYKQLGNGIVKMAATGLGTFAQSFATIPNTIEAAKKLDVSELSGKDGYEADVDRWLKNLEDAFPNYVSEWEKDHPFSGIIPFTKGSANFWGDKIIKNLGFTAGAIGGALVQDVAVGFVTGGIGEIPLLGAQIGKASLYLNKIFTGTNRLDKVLELAKDVNKSKDFISNLSKLAVAAETVKVTNGLRYGLALYGSARTEAAVESRQAYEKVKTDLTEEYKLQNNGKSPSGRDLEEIEKYATDAMNVRFGLNMAILTASNVIQFDNLFRSFTSASKKATSSIPGGNLMGLKEGSLDVFERKTLSKIDDVWNAARPSVKNILTEGFYEEGGQYAVEKGVENYYTRKYKNKESWNTLNEMIKSTNYGLSEQFGSDEGLQNMLVGALSALITGGISSKIETATGAKVSEDEKLNTSINILNQFGVTGILSEQYSSTGNSAQIAKEMKDAAQSGNVFKYKNLKNDQFFAFVYSRIPSGLHDVTVEQLNMLKDLNKEEFEKSFGMDFNESSKKTVNEYVDSLITKANEINSIYKSVDSTFKNPFTFRTKEETAEDIEENNNYKVFNEWKTNLTYYGAVAVDINDRLNNIELELFKVNPLLNNDVMYKMADRTSLKEKADFYRESAASLEASLATETSKVEKDRIRKEIKAFRNFSERLYVAINNNNLDLKTFESVLNFELNGYKEGDKVISPEKLPELYLYSADIYNNIKNKKDASELLDHLMSKKGFKEFVEAKPAEPKTETSSEPVEFINKEGIKESPAVDREYQIENLPVAKYKKLSDESFEVTTPFGETLYFFTEMDALDEVERLNKDLDLMKKVKVLAINPDGSIKVEDLEGNIYNISTSKLAGYEKVETLEEKLQKDKERLKTLREKAELDSGEIPTSNIQDTDFYQEPPLKAAVKLFSSTTTQSEGSNDPRWAQNEVLPFVSRSMEFLNNAKTFPNRSALKTILVNYRNIPFLKLDGLIQLSYNVDQQIPLSEIPKYDSAEDGFLAAIFVEQEGENYYFVDKNGKRIGKVGTDTPSLDELIFQTMPTPSLQNSKGQPRYRSNEKELAEKYKEGWKVVRNTFWKSDPSKFLVSNFTISRGVPTKGVQKNYVGDVLIPSSSISSTQGIIVINTTGSISHNGESVNFPKGVPVLQFGDTLEFINNSKFSKNYAKSLFNVIKAMADDLVSKKESGKPAEISKRFETFLQNVLFYKKSESPVSNQLFYDEETGDIVIGSNRYPVSKIDSFEEEIINILSETYFSINKSTLDKKFNDKFYELYAEKNEQGQVEIKEREWDNYQSFLLSNKYPDDTNRSVEETPLTTFVEKPTSVIPYSFKQKYATLTDISIPIQTVPPVAAPTPVAPTAPVAPATVPSKKVGTYTIGGKVENKMKFGEPIGTITFTADDDGKGGFTVISTKESFDGFVKSVESGEKQSNDILKTFKDYLNKVYAAVPGIFKKDPNDMSVLEIAITMNNIVISQRLSQIQEQEQKKTAPVQQPPAAPAPVVTPAPVSDVEAKRKEVRAAIQKAGQGEGGQFFVTLSDGTREGAVRISLVGNELGIGNKGVTVDLSNIVKIENPDGTIVYNAALKTTPAEAPVVSDKKTDIETLRQKLIDSIETVERPSTDGGFRAVVYYSELLKNNKFRGFFGPSKIDAILDIKKGKYDAELAALEGAKPDDKKPPAPPAGGNNIVGPGNDDVELREVGKEEISDEERITPEELRIFEEYMQNVAPNIPYEYTNNMIKVHGNRKAWGVFEKGVIKFMKTGLRGTEYHELAEAIWKGMLSVEEQNAIIEDEKSKGGTFIDRASGRKLEYATATRQQIKERIMDDFADFRQGKLPARSLKERILNFFKSILEFFKLLTKKPSLKDELFDKIEKGAFKKKTMFPSVYNAAAEYRAAEGLTELQTHEFAEDFTARAALYLFKNAKKLLFSPSKITGKEVYDYIKSIYDKIPASQRMTDKAFDQVFEKAKDKLKTIGISIELEGIEFDEAKNSRDYAPEPFSVNWKKTSPAAIKFVLASLLQVKYNSDTKSLSTVLSSTSRTLKLVSFGKAFANLMENLSNTSSVEGVVNKLFEVAKNDPNYISLIKRLGGNISNDGQVASMNFEMFRDEDWRLFINLYQSFTKQRPNAIIQLLDGIDVYSSTSDLQSAKNQVQNRWIENIKALAQSRATIKSVKDGSEHILVKFDTKSKTYSLKGDVISNYPTKLPQEKLDFLNMIGISFSREAYDKLSDFKSRREKKSQKQRFDDAVEGIKAYLGKTGQIYSIKKRTLEASGHMSELSELYVKSLSVEQDVTYIGIEGTQVGAYSDNNAPSLFENEFNTSSNLKELKDKRPELNDVFSRNSVVLKNGGLFYDKDGDLIKDFKVGYVQGSKDLENGRVMTGARITLGYRLTEEINQNIKGEYVILNPGDGSTNWVMNIGNNITYENYVGERGWGQTYIIFRGYLEDDIALALDWKNRKRLANIGDKAKELRFFKDILPENILKQINSKIAKETPLNQIMKYVDENIGAINNAVKDHIEEKVKKTKKDLQDTKEIKMKGEDSFSYIHLDSDFAKEQKIDKLNLTSDSINNLLIFININGMIANIEYHKILFGDPYGFKITTKKGVVIYDETKRVKNFLSPARTMFDHPEYNNFLNREKNKAKEIPLKAKDEKGNATPGYHLHKSYTSTITIKDDTIVGSLVNTIPAYGNVNVADAMSWIMDSTFREVKMKNGQWSDEAEDFHQWQMAYTRNRLAAKGKYFYPSDSDRLKAQDEKTLKKSYPKYFLDVIKPIVRGNKLNKNEFDIVVDKFSQMPLYYSLVEGTNLENLYLQMLQNGDGYAITESGRKLGVEETHPLYTENGTFNTAEVERSSKVDVPWKAYSIQVETSYEEGKEQSRGSQITKIASADLFENGVPVSEEAREAYDKNLKFLDLMHDNAYKELMIKLGIEDTGMGFRMKNGEAISKALLSELLRKEVSSNVKDSVSIDEITKEFIVPLEATGSYQQIKSVLYSFINRSIVSPKVNGGQHVQVSVTGFEKLGSTRKLVRKVGDKFEEIGLKEYKTLSDEEKKKVFMTESTLKFYTEKDPYCEIMLPHWFKIRFGRKFANEKDLLNYLNNTAEGRKILTGVGFRIPSQAVSSAEVFRVKGFLPDYMGSTVVVPAEITTKTGSDFDIDKLNLYLKSIYLDAKGDIKLVRYLGSEEATKKFYSDNFDKILKRKIVVKNEIREAAAILSYGLDDPNDLLEKYGDLLDILLEGVDDPNDFDDKIMNEIKNLKDENFQAVLREKYVKGMYKRSLENEYFESLEKLLTLNFKRLVSPVDDAGLSDKAKQLADLRGGQAPIKNAMIDRNYLSYLRHLYLMAKNWIGIVAVNITSHAQMQKAPSYIDPQRIARLTNKKDRKILGDGIIHLPHNKVKTPNGEMISLSGIETADGSNSLISARLSGYATLTVDVVKDPAIAELIQSDLLIGTAMFLERIGAGEAGIDFLNQPIIIEYVKHLESKNKRFLFDPREMVTVRKNFGGDVAETPFEKPFEAKNLQKNIKDYYQGTFTKEQLTEQQEILTEFLKYAKMAEHSFKFTQAINYDTTKFTSGETLTRKQLRTQTARTENIICCVENVIGNTFLKVQSSLLDSFKSAMSAVFKTERDEFRVITENTVMKPYANNEFLGLDDFQKIANRIKASFLDYLILTKTSVGSRLHELMINPDTNVASRVVEMAKKYPELEILQKFEPITSDRINGAKSIKLFVNDKTAIVEDYHIGLMRELRDFNQETNTLYHDIVDLSILQGVYQTPLSIKNIIPIEDYSARVAKVFSTLTIDNEVRSFAEGRFQRNNWKNEDAVPTVTPATWIKTERDPYSGEYVEKLIGMFDPGYGEPTEIYEYIAAGFVEMPDLGVTGYNRAVFELNQTYNEKASQYDVIKVPRVVLDKVTGEAVDVISGQTIPKQDFVTRKQKGDLSLKDFYGYKKVVNPVNGEPLTYVNYKGDVIHVYKQINLYGDSPRTIEHPVDFTSSEINNGTPSVVEIPDDRIVDAYVSKNPIVSNAKTAPTPASTPIVTSGTKINIYTETLEEVKTPKKADVKTEFKSVNFSSGKEGIKKGYKLTFEEYPNAEIYITKDVIEEDGQTSTMKYWMVEETKTSKVFPIESSKLSDIVEEMRDIVNKQMKSETGRKVLESVGFTNKPKEEYKDPQTPAETADLLLKLGAKRVSKGMLKIDGQHWYLDMKYWKSESKVGRRELFIYPNPDAPLILQEEIYIGDAPGNSDNFTTSSKTPVNFDNLTEFSSERKQEILTNFAAKHKMTQGQAINYINEALQKNRSEVIAKLKECY